MSVLSYANRTIYSASVHNDWQRRVFRGYELATSYKPVFRGFNDSATTTLYLYYSGDTNVVYFQKTGGAITVNINGVDYTPSGDSGTFTVSGLTAHTVYAAVVSGVSSLSMLAFQYQIGSTTAPTFTNGNVLTVSNMTDMYNAVSEVNTASDILPMPHSLAYSYGYKPVNASGSGSEYGGEGVVMYGGFVGGAKTIQYNWDVGADLELDISVRVIVKIYISGTWTTVFQTDYPSGRTETPGSWTDSKSGTIDISSYGLTAGQVYPIQINRGATGDASQKVYHWVTIHNLQLYDTSSLAVSPVATYSRGTVVDASGLSTMVDAINIAHPSYGTAPLWTHQFAVYSPNIIGTWKPDDSLRIRHMRNFLRYRPHGSDGDPLLVYSGGSIALQKVAGDYTYDLYNISDLGSGEYYTVTNCAYAFEDDTDA